MKGSFHVSNQLLCRVCYIHLTVCLPIRYMAGIQMAIMSDLYLLQESTNEKGATTVLTTSCAIPLQCLCSNKVPAFYRQV